MNCIKCDRPAHGMCRFCGRAICKDHFVSSNFIQSFSTLSEQCDKALVVEDALFCGLCRPCDQMVELKWSGASPSD